MFVVGGPGCIGPAVDFELRSDRCGGIHKLRQLELTAASCVFRGGMSNTRFEPKSP
jgi:hypothetical protein